jgi:CBS domain-containing protein
MKKIEDVMVRDIVTIDPLTSVADAASRMREANVGMLPIVEDGELRAVLTDRDLVVRALAAGIDPESLQAIECATREPIAAQPDWDVDDALEVMGKQQVGRLPVVGEDGRLVGIVTLGSLILRGEDEGGMLETARRVTQRAAKRPPSRGGQRAKTTKNGRRAGGRSGGKRRRAA